MSDMDAVCKQRFDKLSLMIENKQNTSWKEVWKTREENMTMGEECPTENGKSSDTDDRSAGTPMNVTGKNELLESSESILADGHVKNNAEDACMDYSINDIEIDVDLNENEAHIDDVSNNHIDDSCNKEDVTLSVNSTESADPSDNDQSQGDNFVKVCGISSCSYFGKPDPLIPIAKVDHSSSFECYEIGTPSKKDGNSDIILESDQNMQEHDQDSGTEAVHDTSDIEIEYSKGKCTPKSNFNTPSCRYFQGIRESRAFRSSCKKSDSCDVVQISSSDDDDGDDEEDEDIDDDDDESVHSHFINAREEPLKKPVHPANYACSLITMEVPELNICAMKAGPISCFPDRSCIFFKDFNNHSSQDASRETIVQVNSLESHHWLPMFGGLVLEITLNLTGCHENIMTFFQVPLIKIAGYCLRFPLVVLKIYFEARVVDLTMRHNFQQFLNCDQLGRNGSWHGQEKNREERTYHVDVFRARKELGHSLPPSRKFRARRVHPYMMKVVRSSRASSKFSYYKFPKWPYLKKIDCYEKKKRNFFKKNEFCSSGFEPHVGMPGGQWSMPGHPSQNYYRTHVGYYNQQKMTGPEFVVPSAGINAFNPMNQHVQQNPGMGIQIPNSQTGQWFDRMQQREQQSPVYITSGFQGTTTKLFTYKPPNSKGGINVTNEDLFCLNDGEYLNDVIIDFYLKYLMEELVSSFDKQRTHVFSSFFYGHLISGNDAFSNLSPEEQRHGKVRTWTRHVDIFSKDFIIVPINESYHWFLAIICFPNVNGITKYRHAPLDNLSLRLNSPCHIKNSINEQEVTSLQKETKENVDAVDQKDSVTDTQEVPIQVVFDPTNEAPSASLRSEDSKHSATEEAPEEFSNLLSDATLAPPSIAETQSSNLQIEEGDNKMPDAMMLEPPNKIANDEESVNNAEEKDIDAMDDDILMEINSVDGEEERSPESSSTKRNHDECGDSSPLEYRDPREDPDSKEDFEPGVSPEGDCNPRNPCILIFDSLKGESRYDVVNILRQYLQVEWNLKKRDAEGERVFDKSTMKGSMVTCPQQPNSSDCGIYVLQFVESFFKDPVKDFTLPLSLADWFTSRVAMSKRFQLAKLIMKLKEELNPTHEYDPSTDGCFNIAPIVSDDDEEEDKEEEEDKNSDKGEEVTELESKEEKSKAEENDRVEDEVGAPCELVALAVEVAKDVVRDVGNCDIRLDNLDSACDAEIFSSEEQNKLNV